LIHCICASAVAPRLNISVNGTNDQWVGTNVSFVLNATVLVSPFTANYKIITDGYFCDRQGLSTGQIGEVACTSGQVCAKRVCYSGNDSLSNYDYEYENGLISNYHFDGDTNDALGRINGTVGAFNTGLYGQGLTNVTYRYYKWDWQNTTSTSNSSRSGFMRIKANATAISTGFNFSYLLAYTGTPSPTYTAADKIVLGVRPGGRLYMEIYEVNNDWSGNISNYFIIADTWYTIYYGINTTNGVQMQYGAGRNTNLTHLCIGDINGTVMNCSTSQDIRSMTQAPDYFQWYHDTGLLTDNNYYIGTPVSGVIIDEVRLYNVSHNISTLANYSQLRELYSPYQSAVFLIDKSPPNVTAINISTYANYSSNLTCTFNYTDAGTQNVSANITWYKNGIANNTFDSSIGNLGGSGQFSTAPGYGSVVSGLVGNHTWICQITLNDTLNIYARNSTSLRINTTLPTTTIVIDNKPISRFEQLNISTTYTNYDGYAFTQQDILWYNNSVLMSAYNNATGIPAGIIEVGEQWTAAYRVCDPFGCGPYSNDTITVGDFDAPVIYGISLDSAQVAVSSYSNININVSDYASIIYTTGCKVTANKSDYTPFGGYVGQQFNITSYRYSGNISTIPVFGNQYGVGTIYITDVYCSDSSGNTAHVGDLRLSLVINEIELPRVGGGGVSTQKKNCVIMLTPSIIDIGQSSSTVRVTIENKQQESYAPVFSITGDSAISPKLSITNAINTLLPGTRQEFGIQYSTSEFVTGSATVTLQSSNCNDIQIPVRVSEQGGAGLFEGLFSNGIDLQKLWSTSIFAGTSELNKDLPYATIGWLFIVIVIVCLAALAMQFSEAFKEEKYGIFVLWIVFTALTSSVVTAFIVTVIRVIT
jgi:hypothetical protein